MKKVTHGQDVPLGLGIALEKCNAMDYFFSLPAEEQQRMIGGAHSVQSQEEMLAYVQSAINKYV